MSHAHGQVLAQYDPQSTRAAGEFEWGQELVLSEHHAWSLPRIHLGYLKLGLPQTETV